MGWSDAGGTTTIQAGDAPASMDEMISFLTPYWCGQEMMRIHLGSIRQFYPQAPILVSKKDDDAEEMEAHRAEFGIRYWLEDCGYWAALLRLLKRCDTEYVCICDHDTVLLSGLGPLLQGLRDGRYELVGIEERIRFPDRDEWLRFAPGYMDTAFMMFNLTEFIATWGPRGIKGRRTPGTLEWEEHYGICQKLKLHKYLLPFHAPKYGLANLLKDGETPVVWHQWYGSYRARLGPECSAGAGAGPGGASLTDSPVFDLCDLSKPYLGVPVAQLARAERTFLADYPHLDLSELTPAWGPGCDVRAEQLAAARDNPRTGVRGLAARAWAKFRRWRAARYERRRRAQGPKP
jgi:hypothetical protein